MRIEIFTPPYLQKDTPRPTVASAPTEIAYGGSYSLGTTQAAPLRSAVLVRPGAVTHSSDPGQRLVDLPFTTTANGVSVNVHRQPQPRAAGLVHALRGRRQRRAVSREVGPPELSPPHWARRLRLASALAPARTGAASRTISTSASPARNTIEIQPSVRTCQKNVGHSNVGGQVRVPLLGRDVGAASRERDRRQQAQHRTRSAGGAGRAAPPPRAGRRPTASRRPHRRPARPASRTWCRTTRAVHRRRRAAMTSVGLGELARVDDDRARPSAPPAADRRDQHDREAHDDADDGERDRRGSRSAAAPTRCSRRRARPGVARADEPAVAVAVGERRLPQLLAVGGRPPTRRCCSGPAPARTASWRPVIRTRSSPAPPRAP